MGFSQGGLIAQQLADEGSFNVKTVMTYGSPIAPEARNYGGADLIRLEHFSDPVPAIPTPKNVFNAVTPVLDIFTGNTPPPKGDDVRFVAGTPQFGAHNQDDYEWVAEQFDKSGSWKHDHAKESLRRFSGEVVADEK